MTRTYRAMRLGAIVGAGAYVLASGIVLHSTPTDQPPNTWLPFIIGAAGVLFGYCVAAVLYKIEDRLVPKSSHTLEVGDLYERWDATASEVA